MGYAGPVTEAPRGAEPALAPRISIIGNGHVGRAMQAIFPDAAVYDKYQAGHDDRPAVQDAALALICVPTPSLPDGGADTSTVREVVGWLDAEIICIKSTIPPGTTDALRAESGKRVVCSPEYQGETPWQRGARDWPFVIVGGEREEANKALGHFQRALGPEKVYRATTAVNAELTKYMENVALAMYVTFANEFYGIAQAVGADYDEVRDLWALDPRMARSHTLVFPHERGFGGKCLPKDLQAIIVAAQREGYWPDFLKAIRDANERFRLCSQR